MPDPAEPQSFTIISPDKKSISPQDKESIANNPNRIITPATFILNEQNQPSAVEIGDQHYEVRLKTQTTTIANFLDLAPQNKHQLFSSISSNPDDYRFRPLTGGNPFKHPLALAFYEQSIFTHQVQMVNQISEAFEQDSKDISPPEIKEFTKKVNDQISKDAAEESNQYFDYLRQTFGDSPVTIRRYLVNSRPPIEHLSITLGKIDFTNPQDEFDIDAYAISTIHFANTVLHEPPPKKPTIIFLTALPETETGSGNYQNTLCYKQGSCCGFFNKNVIVVDSLPSTKLASFDEDKIKTKITFNQEFLRNHHIHETAHHMDSQIESHTSCQKEGFAVSFEYDFDYSKIKNLLYSNHSQFRHQTTPSRLLEVFSTNPPQVITKERYFLTGAFLSWIYQHHGPNAFISFYHHLANPQIYPNEKPTHRALASLTLALQTDKKSPPTPEDYQQSQNLIADFLEYINTPPSLQEEY